MKKNVKNKLVKFGSSDGDKKKGGVRSPTF